MKKYKRIFILLTVMIMIQYSCTKETNIDDTYIVTDYYPGSQELVKKEVLSFLNFTIFNKNSSYKTNTEFEDTDPSEGSWVMEGASNYIVNVNIYLKTDTVIDLIIEVENFLDSNEKIKMKGGHMVSVFNQLHNELLTIEESLDKLTRLIDYEIKEVSPSKTTINVSAVFGSVENEGSGYSSYPNDISPLTLFNYYEADLLIDLGGSSSQFYTNITYWGLSPYTHIWDVNSPDYWPEQDPNSSLYNPNFPRCGINNGQYGDCRVCYDCLWSEIETTFTPYNSSTGSWSSAQADYYFDGTKTVIENFINNGSYQSALLTVDVHYTFIVCGCPNEAWESVTMNLGVGSNY